jgi:hypothetical protein
MSFPHAEYKAYDGEIFFDREAYRFYEASLLKPCKLCGGPAKWICTPKPIGEMCGPYRIMEGCGIVACRDCGVSLKCTLGSQPVPEDKAPNDRGVPEQRLKAALEEVRRRWQVLMGK